MSLPGSGKGNFVAAEERRQRMGGSMALTGVKVVDLAHAWAGPTCSVILADLGAGS